MMEQRGGVPACSEGLGACVSDFPRGEGTSPTSGV